MTTGLNTCIGESNYKQFYRTMVSLFCMECIHFIVQVILILDIFIGFDSTKQRANEWIFGGYTVIVAVLLFFVIFNIGSMFLLGQLILFHMNLQKQNLTTYEYIVLDSKKKREINRMKGDLENLRMNEMTTARRNHQFIYSTQLSCGGYCRNDLNCPYFDPLKLPSTEMTTTTPDNEMNNNNDDDNNNNDDENHENGETSQHNQYDEAPIVSDNNDYDAVTDQNDIEMTNQK